MHQHDVNDVNKGTIVPGAYASLHASADFASAAHLMLAMKTLRVYSEYPHNIRSMGTHLKSEPYMVSSLGRCLEEKTFTVLPKPTMWTSGGRPPARPPMLGMDGTSRCSCSCSPLLSAHSYNSTSVISFDNVRAFPAC